jgi:tRNA modification GTPase
VIHKGVPLKLVDTAGIRDSQDPVEMLGIQRAKEAMVTSQIRILVLDGSTPPSQEDLKLLTSLEKPALAALNKSDKGILQEWRDLLDRPQEIPYFEVSALNGDGVEELKDRMVETFFSMGSLEGAVSLFRHQVDNLKRSAQCLEEAAGASFLDAMVHLASRARQHLGAAMGRDTTEELLDSIFSNFCIGK